MSSYFLYQAYEVFFNKEKWASSLYSAYGKFEEYWNKHLRKRLINEFSYSVPAQKAVYPYKYKASLIMGYLYGFGGLFLWTGERWAPLILLVPHTI